MSDDDVVTVGLLRAALERLAVDQAACVTEALADLTREINEAFARPAPPGVIRLEQAIVSAPPGRRTLERDEAGNLTAIVDS